MGNSSHGPGISKVEHTKLQRKLVLNGISHFAHCANQDPVREGVTQQQKATGTEPGAIHITVSLPAGLSCSGNQLHTNRMLTQKQALPSETLETESRELSTPLLG